MAIVGALGVTVAGQAVAAPLPTVDRSARPASARAMWVWDTSDPQAVVSLATARGIGQLYAAVPAHVDSSPELAELQRLVALADVARVRVDALGGDPGWVDDPARVVTSWLQPALATGLFTGVHVDIEPYTTPAWTKNRRAVITRYLATLDRLHAATAGAPIEADIPFWFDEVPANGSTLDREVMRRTEAVAVMAYRNHADGPDGTIAVASAGVAAGAQLGRPVRIGQETNDLGVEPTEVKQTFHGMTLAQMDSQLSLVRDAFSGSPAFAGLAIHDSRGYAAITG
ncbi:hypothetical protein BJ986_000794 [Phycicoccus badiiscoriae]|uniref:Amidase n=1 Tax=Pedococcus badiiscoriae TaxID=642776 RepID=A0A852WAM9_9MICO|nr:hypothetical protein [Pedococcus badiiscoriae]NYG06307.1 hypothetical protein [Pedococcus badiiscoriae]